MTRSVTGACHACPRSANCREIGETAVIPSRERDVVFPLRDVYEEASDRRIVVTAYLTSDVERYWKEKGR